MWLLSLLFFFFFKQKTAYEMRISDWSSDVCSSDLLRAEFDRLVIDRHATGRDQRVGFAPRAQAGFTDVLVQAHGVGCYVAGSGLTSSAQLRWRPGIVSTAAPSGAPEKECRKCPDKKSRWAIASSTVPTVTR